MFQRGAMTMFSWQKHWAEIKTKHKLMQWADAALKMFYCSPIFKITPEQAAVLHVKQSKQVESALHKEKSSCRNDHNMSHAVPHAGPHKSSVFRKPTQACVRTDTDTDKWTRTLLARIHALIIQTIIHQNSTEDSSWPAKITTYSSRAPLMPSACEIAHENVSQCCYGYWLFTSKHRDLQSIKTHTCTSQYISCINTVCYVSNVWNTLQSTCTDR